MSMADVINSIEYGSFSRCMNPPEPHNGQAYMQYDRKTGKNWIHCPHCGKRQFPMTDGASIKGQVFKCKASDCKQEFVVNVG